MIIKIRKCSLDTEGKTNFVENIFLDSTEMSLRKTSVKLNLFYKMSGLKLNIEKKTRAMCIGFINKSNRILCNGFRLEVFDI